MKLSGVLYFGQGCRDCDCNPCGICRPNFDEGKRNYEIRSNRKNIRSGFSDAVIDLVTHYDTAINNLLNENYRKRIKKIDNRVFDFRLLRKSKSDTYNLLEETQNECRQLISDIRRESIIQQDV